jgi:hypothetical protein
MKKVKKNSSYKFIINFERKRNKSKNNNITPCCHPEIMLLPKCSLYALFDKWLKQSELFF